MRLIEAGVISAPPHDLPLICGNTAKAAGLGQGGEIVNQGTSGEDVDVGCGRRLNEDRNKNSIEQNNEDSSLTIAQE